MVTFKTKSSLLFFLVVSCISLSAQCDCEEILHKNCRDCGMDPSRPSLIVGFKMLFYPIDSAYYNYFIVDSVRPDSYICYSLCNPLYKDIPRFHFCKNVIYTYYLNQLNLSDSQIIALSLDYEKDMLKTLCKYEFVFFKKRQDSISQINFFLTTKIPIYLNNELVPFDQSEEVLGQIQKKDIISIQRIKRRYRRKNDRIDIITR